MAASIMTNITPPTNNKRRPFAFNLASNFFFVVASGLYLWLSFLDYQYYDRISGIPDEVLGADDDASWEGWWPHEDDYVFEIKADVWVSKYMILYFVAAYCFVMVGVIDCVGRTGWVTGGLMLLAGLFGLAAAAIVERNVWLSSILNSVSVHLFLLEAVQVLVSHVPAHHHFCVKCVLYLGDICFVLGALLDVVLSYFAVMDKYSYDMARAGVLASILWMAAALIYFASTFCMDEPPAQQREIGTTDKSTVTGTTMKGAHESHAGLRSYDDAWYHANVYEDESETSSVAV